MTHKKVIEKELDGFGIRLNQKPPDIVFRKKDKGGLNYQEVVPQVCVPYSSSCADNMYLAKKRYACVHARLHDQLPYLTPHPPKPTHTHARARYHFCFVVR